jgi:hypothetical protein
VAKVEKKSLQDEPQEPQNEPETVETPFEPEESPAEPEQEAAAPTIVEHVEPGTADEEKRRQPGRPRKAFSDDAPSILDALMALETWEGVWAYVYRIQPFTNRLVGGNRRVHVKRWDTPFDAQTLMEEAGSGVYDIQATRLNPATGKRPMFLSGEVRILNTNHPPKVPPGEWVDDPRNKEWAWAKKAIFAADKPEAPADPLVSILRETIQTQRSEMADIRKELRTKPAGEVTFLSVLAPLLPALITKLTAAPPPPPPPPAPPDPVAQITAIANLIKSLQPAPVAPPAEVDPVALLDKQIDLSKKIQDLAPDRGSRGSRKTGWQEVITEIAPAFAEIAKPFAQVIASGMIMHQQQVMQQQAQQRAQQQAQQPPPAPPPMIPAAEPQPVQQAAPAPSPGPQIVKKIPTLELFADQVIHTLKNQESGLDLGDWYLKEFGPEEFRELRLQGKEKIIADLRTTVPQWGQIAPFEAEGELDQVIEDLLTWEEPDDDDEEDDDEVTPPLAADAMRSGWENQETTV